MTINLANLAHRLGNGWQPVQYTVFGDNHALTAHIQGPRPGYQSLILDTAIHRDGTGTHRLRLELPHALRISRRTHPNQITAPLTIRLERLATRAHRELLTLTPGDLEHLEHLEHHDEVPAAPIQNLTGATEYAQTIADRLGGETIGTMALVKPDPATGAIDIDIDTADYVYDRNRNAWTPCTRLHLALTHGPATDTVITALAATLTPNPATAPQP